MQKIHAQYAQNILVNFCQVVAKIAGKNVELVIDSDETRAAKDYRNFNPMNKFPVLETAEGNIFESHAVAKFLAHGHATLLGSNNVERAQIDQWMNWGLGVLPTMYPAVMAITGRSDQITQPIFNDAVKALKEAVRAIDQALKGDWLVGNSVSLADIVLAATLSMPFQLILDQGFTKAAPKACAWFERVAAIPEFISIFGKVKIAKKSIKPVIKTEEKPKAAAQQAAAKPKPDEEKKAGNPLDALPPTPFDLFNFKTFFVNHPDKKGDGHKAFMDQVDKEGWSFWWLHYEKYGDEGQVSYKFSNLLEGFVQRLEGFKKYSFGKVCMLGEEPSLEIMGVLLIRGQVIAQELIDHPQFEYMQARKMDWNNADDMGLVRDFMASKEGGEDVKGMKVQMSLWHK